MHKSTLEAAAASLAALAVIVSLGTSPVLARGGGGGGHFGGGGTFVGGGAGFGGFHAGGGFRQGGGFHPMYGGAHTHNDLYGGYNACVVSPTPGVLPYLC